MLVSFFFLVLTDFTLFVHIFHEFFHNGLKFFKTSAVIILWSLDMIAFLWEHSCLLPLVTWYHCRCGTTWKSLLAMQIVWIQAKKLRFWEQNCVYKLPGSFIEKQLVDPSKWKLYFLFFPPNLNFVQRGSLRPFTVRSPWFRYSVPMVCNAVKTGWFCFPGKSWL